MKEKWLKFKRKADKITDNILEVDFTLLVIYIIFVAVISIVVKSVGGEYSTFVLVSIGTLLGRAFGIFERKQKEKRDL